MLILSRSLHRPGFPLLCCLLLAACGTTEHPRSSRGSSRVQAHWTRPGITGSLPAASSGEVSGADEQGAPQQTMLPVGIGLTTGPTSTLLGATLDLPLDEKLTVGPSVQYGFDSDVDILTAGAQLRYFLPIEGTESGSFAVLPYLTGGAGITSIDKERRSGDSGLYLDAGVGVRYLTGASYRIGSEARLYVMPDEVAGEHTFFSFELLQVVISF